MFVALAIESYIILFQDRAVLYDSSWDSLAFALEQAGDKNLSEIELDDLRFRISFQMAIGQQNLK